MDIFSIKKRSQIMSKIKGKDTQLEEEGWALLRESGIRFRKHLKGIPGKPDAANKRKRLAIFIDSEFWHGFEWKKRKKDFKSNKKFWIPKIERNVQRRKEIKASGGSCNHATVSSVDTEMGFVFHAQAMTKEKAPGGSCIHDLRFTKPTQ